MFKLNIPLATFVKIFVLAAFLVTAVQVPAFAAWKNLEVHNNTGRTISKLYLSQSGYGTWGKNVLNGILHSGYYRTVRYDTQYTYFDLKIVFSDGKKITWKKNSQLNLSGAWRINIYRDGSIYRVAKN